MDHLARTSAGAAAGSHSLHQVYLVDLFCFYFRVRRRKRRSLLHLSTLQQTRKPPLSSIWMSALGFREADCAHASTPERILWACCYCPAAKTPDAAAFLLAASAQEQVLRAETPGWSRRAVERKSAAELTSIEDAVHSVPEERGGSGSL